MGCCNLPRMGNTQAPKKPGSESAKRVVSGHDMLQGTVHALR